MTVLLPLAWLALLPGGDAAAGTVLRHNHVAAGSVTPALTYSVYLPDGPDAPAGYPVVYLLHGYGASGEEWLELADLADVLDRMIAARTIEPLIAVMPDAYKSWYVDSAQRGGPGDYETAIVQALVREVDGRFPTRAHARDRAVVGVSMGGFGALRLAFKHPDVFGAVAALSPGLFKPDGVSWQHGPAGARGASRDQWYARTFGAPFDLEIYKAQSPFAYVPQLGTRATPPDVMLMVGDDDGFGSYDGTVEMFLALRAGGLKPELRVADGGHDWRLWRAQLPEALTFLDACWRTSRSRGTSGGS